MADLIGLLKRLKDHRVQFVLVGGYAAAAYGVTLVTEDVDVCCRFSPANLLRLQVAVKDLHPVHRMTPDRLPLTLNKKNCRGLKNLYLSTDWGVLDCLGAIAGIGDYREVRRVSRQIDLGFGRVPVLRIEALIRAKETMGRPRDRQALLQLRTILTWMKKQRLSMTDRADSKKT